MKFKVLILAAGKGTRFKSELPKVLHKILGKPMLYYVIKAALDSGAEEVGVVIGHKKELVEEYLKKEFPQVKTFYQEEQLGTGHAVLTATPFFENYNGRLIVLNGDTPLIEKETIKALSSAEGDLIVLTSETKTPAGYGRILRKGKEIIKIVEEKDASEEEKKITEINTGIYAFNAKKLPQTLKKLKNHNAQKEYYLTDLVEIFKKEGLKVTALFTEKFESVMGVNNRYELSKAEELLKRKILKKHQLNGVTIHNPQSAYIEPEVEIGKDTEIFAPIYIKGKTKIGKNCFLDAYSTIEDATLENNVTVNSHCWIKKTTLKENSSVGPFAKLRPGTILENSAKIGTFVETKNAHIKRGAKANHLSYLGDCTIGENTNIGAGTITCNYDGFNKWKTEIGKNVFVGSNTLFVAPVKVEDQSITAAGSVITKDVPPNTLAIAREKQINLVGKAEAIRKKKREQK